MSAIIYLIPEKLVEYNILALNTIKAKKADKAEVMSYSKIVTVLNNCRDFEGDVYDKAVILLKGLIQSHPFASGNRRTAFLAAKDFLIANKTKFNIKNEPSDAKVLQGIRERYYSDLEIKEWLKNGEIREFER
jgi:prophage maintenance system killer protein